MSDWNPRRGSEIHRSASTLGGLRAGLAAWALIVVFAPCRVGSVVPAVDPGADSAVAAVTRLSAAVGAPGSSVAIRPTLAFAAGVEPTARQQRWLLEDRAWLQGLPATGLLDIPPGAAVEDTAWVHGEQGRQWIGRVVRAAAAQPDSLPGVRPLTSLVRDRWLARGHFAAEVVHHPAGGSDPPVVVVTVDPGPRYAVAAFEVAGDPFPGKDALLRTWLPAVGEPFDAAQVERAVERLLDGAAQNGHPFARWVTRRVTLDEQAHTVTVAASLLPGQGAVVGPVTSDLPAGPGARFLVRAAGMASGAPFAEAELRRAVQRLIARDIYASVGEPRVYLTSHPDTVGIHFPVTPRRKVNRLQAVLGLSRRDRDPSQAEEPANRLSGEVVLHLPNLAGTGRSLRTDWRDDGDGRSRFGFGYVEPLIFGTPLDQATSLEHEVHGDDFTRFRVDGVWRLPVVALWDLQWGLGWDRTTYPAGDLQRSNRVRAGGAVAHRRGDPARDGWRGLFAVDTAWRSSAVRDTSTAAAGVTDGALATQVVQRILRVDAEGEVWLSGAVSLAGRASFRQQTGGDKVVALDEQFRFGGAVSLRGALEEEFHGNRAAWGGMEVRIGRAGGSRLYTFVDVGYFEFWTRDSLAGDTMPIRHTGKPWGLGLGVLARTSGGDISLAVGFPGTVDFDLAKLHVTLIESF